MKIGGFLAEWIAVLAGAGKTVPLRDDAGEVFPAESDVVNVANMRHLWLLREPPPFGWRRG